MSAIVRQVPSGVGLGMDMDGHQRTGDLARGDNGVAACCTHNQVKDASRRFKSRSKSAYGSALAAALARSMWSAASWSPK